MDPVLLDIPDSIVTERLMLRVPGPGDGAIVYPSVRASIEPLHQWMPWAKLDYAQADAELWCRKSRAEFVERKSVQLLMFLGKEHVGTLGAFDLNHTVRSCEIGYWVRTDQSGHGLMTEAVSALSEYVSGHLRMRRVQIKCDTRNQRSAAVARRCGYALDGTLRCDSLDPQGGIRDTHVFSRLFDPA